MMIIDRKLRTFRFSKTIQRREKIQYKRMLIGSDLKPYTHVVEIVKQHGKIFVRSYEETENSSNLHNSVILELYIIVCVLILSIKIKIT